MSDPAGGGSFRMAWMDALLSTPHTEPYGGIDVYARAVAFVLYRHMKPNGTARPGTRRLASQAGISHTIAEDRIRLLEATGWLEVERKNGAANHYSAKVPTAPELVADAGAEDADEASAPATAPRTAPTRSAAKRANPWRGRGDNDRSTAPPEPKSAPTRSHEPRNHEFSSSRRTDTHQKRPRGRRVTRKAIWELMAERTLENERESGRCDIKPTETHRVKPYLATVRERLAEAHDDRVLELYERYPMWDIERFIYELDPLLSQHGWGPALAKANNERLRREAEDAARPAPTAEQVIAYRAEIEASRAKVRSKAASSRRARRTRSAPEPDAEAPPAELALEHPEAS